METSSVIPGSSRNIRLDGNSEASTRKCPLGSHSAASSSNVDLAKFGKDKLPLPLCGLPSPQVQLGISATKLFELVKAGQHCSLQGHWIVNHLSKSEHQKFMILISSDTTLSDHHHHKLRHDYDSKNEIHVIRMSHSILHESLLQELEKLRNCPIKPVAEFVAGIKSIGSTAITINEGYFSPDIQFKRKGSRFPQLVIEIAYSQNGKDLARLAKSYILGSAGNVHQVIGIEIEYRKKNRPRPFLEGRVTVWEPCSKWEDNKFYLETQIVIDHEVFAISNGSTPPDNKSIDTPLKVFETPAFKLSDAASELKISLKYSDLCAWLRTAEEMYWEVEDDTDLWEALAPGQRINEDTPLPESLTQDDERRFADLEEQDELRAAKRAESEEKKKPK